VWALSVAVLLFPRNDPLLIEFLIGRGIGGTVQKGTQALITAARLFLNNLPPRAETVPSRLACKNLSSKDVC
jgi:hypothetical protein